MTAHGIILFSCAVAYMLVSNEKLFKREPHGRKFQIALSVVIYLAVLLPDVGLTLYYYLTIDVIRTPLAFPTIILIYYFLPFPQQYQAIVLGLLASVVHLITSGILHTFDSYYNDGESVRRVRYEIFIQVAYSVIGMTVNLT